MATTETPQLFKPRSTMMRALLASMDMEVGPTISAFMDKAGVDRGQWYKWIKIDGFVAWWNNEWEKFMGAGVFHLDKISYMKAAKDFRYMELLQMKYGKFRRTADFTTDNKPIEPVTFILKTMPKNGEGSMDNGEAGPNTGNPPVTFG